MLWGTGFQPHWTGETRGKPFNMNLQNLVQSHWIRKWGAREEGREQRQRRSWSQELICLIGLVWFFNDFNTTDQKGPESGHYCCRRTSVLRSATKLGDLYHSFLHEGSALQCRVEGWCRSMHRVWILVPSHTMWPSTNFLLSLVLCFSSAKWGSDNTDLIRSSWCIPDAAPIDDPLHSKHFIACQSLAVTSSSSVNHLNS